MLNGIKRIFKQHFCQHSYKCKDIIYECNNEKEITYAMAKCHKCEHISYFKNGMWLN